MDLVEGIKTRRSARKYRSDPIARELLQEVMNLAKWAPSDMNTQPWQVAVVEGTTKQQLADQIISARENNEAPNPDYNYYPDQWEEPYKSRRKACGLALYNALDIQRGDIGKQKQAWNNNYRFFDAPVGLLFFIDKQLNQGSWLDMGMFIQNVMLAATDSGLSTCPQASLAEYPDIVRNLLNIDDHYAVVCGMSLGYEDKTHPANSFRLEREAVNSFTSWYD